MVIVPTKWDKPDNARRMVDVGVALSLSPKQCTPARLRRAVDRLLSEPEFHGRARRFARRFVQGPRGEVQAARLLEGLVTPWPAPGSERQKETAERNRRSSLSDEATTVNYAASTHRD